MLKSTPHWLHLLEYVFILYVYIYFIVLIIVIVFTVVFVLKFLKCTYFVAPRVPTFDEFLAVRKSKESERTSFSKPKKSTSKKSDVNIVKVVILIDSHYDTIYQITTFVLL